MAIDYNDPRLTEIEAKQNKALDDTKEAIEEQKAAIDEYKDTQTALQQQQTDLTIQRIEQQKEQTEKDYTKEQSGAYVDWQKQSNQYGANAEQMASAGLKNSGYSESSQVSMYNTYQYRVVAAKESFDRAILEYNNAIKEAQLQNSSILAEIAYNALQQKLALSVELINKTLEIETIYHNQKQDVIGQMNTEIEQARQQELLNIQKAQQELDERKFAYQQEQDAKAAAAAAANKASRAAKVTNLGGAGSKAAVDKVIKKESTTQSTSDASAYSYLNALIASGASKDKVSNTIAIALRDGAITSAEATKLRNTFTPRGVQY